MPSFDIVRTSQPTDSFRVQSIIGTYNLQQQHVTEHFTGNIELPDKWNIGRLSSGVRTAKLKGSFSCNRLTVSFEYIGQTEVATFKK